MRNHQEPQKKLGNQEVAGSQKIPVPKYRKGEVLKMSQIQPDTLE